MLVCPKIALKVMPFKAVFMVIVTENQIWSSLLVYPEHYAYLYMAL